MHKRGVNGRGLTGRSSEPTQFTGQGPQTQQGLAFQGPQGPLVMGQGGAHPRQLLWGQGQEAGLAAQAIGQGG